MKDVLDAYEKASRHKVYFDKMKVSFSAGVVEGKRRCLVESLEFDWWGVTTNI